MTSRTPCWMLVGLLLLAIPFLQVESKWGRPLSRIPQQSDMFHALTSRSTLPSVIARVSHGGAEEEEESSDEEDSSDEEEDMLGEALDTAVDVSKRTATLLAKASKIAGIWIKKYSILYYKACKRALDAGMAGDEEEDDEEESDDEEEQETSQLEVVAKKAYKTIHRMTVAFWSPPDGDADDAAENEGANAVNSALSFFGKFKAVQEANSDEDDSDDESLEYPEAEVIEVLAEEVVEPAPSKTPASVPKAKPVDKPKVAVATAVKATPIKLSKKQRKTKSSKKKRKSNKKSDKRKKSSKATKKSTISMMKRHQLSPGVLKKIALTGLTIVVGTVFLLENASPTNALLSKLISSVTAVGTSLQEFRKRSFSKQPQIYGLEDV